MRKKLINGEKCSEAALGESGKLADEMNKKLENLAQIKVDLEHELEKIKNEKTSLASDVHNLSLKLDEAKGEIQEGLVKYKEVVDKNDKMTHENKKVKEDLTRCKAENENLRSELKTKKVYENEIVRKDNKIENLETSVKNLKGENRQGHVELIRITKEKVKLQNQLQKIEERKKSVSKSTLTISVDSSEASTSTVGISSEPRALANCSQSSQTDSHPEIPYKIEAPLPPIFSSSLVFKSRPVFFTRSHPNLSKIRWRNVTEEEIIDDEIDAIEMEKYDNEIEDFYKEAAEKSRNLREIYEDEHIRKLFDEN